MSWTGRIGALALLAFVYLAVASGGFYRFAHERNYYDLLADGFLAGQTSLTIVPPPAVVSAFERRDYEHLGNEGALGDTALFGGKYYIYFGPAPAVMCAAWKAVGGRACDSTPMMLGFALLAAVAMALCLKSLDALVGPAWPAGRRVVWTLFALGAIQLFMVGFPKIYHLAIGAGTAFTLTACAFFLRWLVDGSRRPSLLAGMGACLALAVSSRIVTIFMAGALLLATSWVISRSTERSRRRQVLDIAIAGMPLVLAVAGLLLYNWWRFGNMLEFGVTYTVAAAETRQVIDRGLLFSPRYIPENLWWYFLYIPPIESRFPFIWLGGNTAFQYQCASALLTSPAIVLATIPFWLVARRRLKNTLLATSVMTLGGGSLVTMTYVLCFVGATKRYEYDFLPAWYLLAFVGLKQLYLAWPSGRPQRTAAGLAVAFLTVWSIAMGTLEGITAASLEFPPFLQLGHWTRRVQARVSPTDVVIIPLDRSHGYPPNWQRLATEAYVRDKAFAMAWEGEVVSEPITLPSGSYSLNLEHFSFANTGDGVYAQFYAWVESESVPVIPITARTRWESNPKARVDRVAVFHLPRDGPVRMHVKYVNDATGALTDRNLYFSAAWFTPAARESDRRLMTIDLRSLSGYPPEQNALAIQEVSRSGQFAMAWEGSVHTDPLALTAGDYQLVVAHDGTAADGIYPQFRISVIDPAAGFSQALKSIVVTSGEEVGYSRDLSFSLESPAVIRIDIAFMNDFGNSREDRNLFLRGLYLIRQK